MAKSRRASTTAANDSAPDATANGGVDELFVVPPERFVAARNALVARLNAEGDDAAAAEVKALERPSPSAWLIDVLVRRAHPKLEALFRAGDALHGAQHRVLVGDAPETLQTATRAVRDALGRAVDEARRVLRESGRRENAALMRRVSTTLRTAAIDRRVREQVLTGRLTADPIEDEDAFLAEVAGAPRAKPPKKHAEAKKHVGPKPAHERTTRRRAAEEKRRAAAEEKRAREARAHAERKQKLVRDAEEALREVDRARAARNEAEAEARRARLAAQKAERAVEEAHRALASAERRRDAAQRAIARAS